MRVLSHFSYRLNSHGLLMKNVFLLAAISVGAPVMGEPEPAGTQARPADPGLMRNVLLWPSGSLADFDRIQKSDINTLHTFPMVPPDSGGLRPLALTTEWIDSTWGKEIARLHGLGIRVWGSISSTGFYPATFEKYGLKPELFYALDIKGQRQMMLGGSFGKEVMSSCYNNPEWMALLEANTIAFVKAGFDGIWYDVGGYADGAVLYCHCKYCQDGWRQYAVEQGLPPDTALPTVETGSDFSKAANRVHLRWRYEIWEAGFRKIRDGAKAVNPELMFLHNLSAMPDGMLQTGLYYVALAKLYDAAHWEEWGHGTAPYSLLPSYFLGRMAAGERPVVLVQNDRPERNEVQHRIALAEAYAAGGVPQNPQFPEITDHFYTYLKREAEYFGKRESLATVAVVTSVFSKDYYENSAGVKPAHWMGWLLQDLHIPYDYLLAERDLTPEALGRYKAIILPDLAVMSDSQITVLRAWLEGGGRILATHDTARYDLEMKDLGRGRLSALAGQSVDGSLRVEVGAGRFVFDAGYPEKDYTVSYPRDLALSTSLSVPGSPPANFKAALDWLVEGILPIEAAARSTTAIIPQRQPGRILVHVINYNTYPDGKQITKDEKVQVTVTLPLGQKVRSVKGVSPDVEGFTTEVGVENRPGAAVLTLMSLDSYTLVAIELEDGASG